MKVDKIKKKALGPAVLGCIIFAVFIALYFIFDLISHDEQGLDFHFERGFKVLAVAVVTFVAMKWYKTILVRSYEKKNNAVMPHIFITLFNVGAIILAALFITTQIFNKDALSLIAAFSVVGAGVAFATQGVILDAFSGVFLDLAGTHKVGDWIKLPNDKMGKVIAINWRSTHVLTPENNIMVIPNGHLVKDGYTNYTNPGKVYYDTVTIGIDHDVPIDRAERILHGAILTIPEIAKHGDCDTYAIKATSGGIDFCIRYPVSEVPRWREFRHKVLEVSIRHLHEAGFKVSEGLGEYALSKASKLVMAEDLTARDALSHVDLFSSLTEDELEKLAKKAKKTLVKKGEAIVKQGAGGSSLFLIGEGAIDVFKEEKAKGKVSELYLATLGPGSFFGAMALLLGEKRSATCRAKTNVVVFEITKTHFSPILKKRSEIATQIANIVAERQLDTNSKVKAKAEREKEKKKVTNSVLAGIKKFFGL